MPLFMAMTAVGTASFAIWAIPNSMTIAGRVAISRNRLTCRSTSPIVPTAPNNAAGNQWVEVDVVVAGGSVSVSYNGVEWFNEDSTETDGFAFLGYEDLFSSITQDDDFADARDGMWGLFDNFVITDVVPEPSSSMLALFGMGLALLSRRRS